MNKQQLIERAQWLRNNAIVIDVESTGMGETDTVVELAAIEAKTGMPIINTLIKPLSPMTPGAFKVHGINEVKAMVGGRAFYKAFNVIAESAIKEKLIITSFNRVFDIRLLMQTVYADGMHPLQALQVLTGSGGLDCIMELANRYFHEHLEWDYEQSKFKRLSLARCMEIAGIERKGNAHRALSDTEAAVALLNHIAEGK